MTFQTIMNLFSTGMIILAVIFVIKSTRNIQEVEESDLARLDEDFGRKVEKLAIYKLYKSFDRSA